MVRILLVNTNISWNKGSAAQVTSIVDDLRRQNPDIDFALISYCMHLDLPWSNHRGIKVVGYPVGRLRSLRHAMIAFSTRFAITLVLSAIWRILSIVGIESRLLKRERFLREFVMADIILDLSGDSLSDKGSHSTINLLAILVAVAMKKPLILYSQSIGPFNPINRRIARFCINRANAIIVRERITRDYLIRIGVRSTIIHEFGDCAFTLSSAGKDRAEEIMMCEGIPAGDRRFTGISVSSLISDISIQTSHTTQSSNRLDPYLTLIVRIVDELTSNRRNVILIPHVIAPQSWIRDDRSVCNEVLERVSDRDHVWTLNSDYSPEELKSIISSCDLFLGSRMHACIAALSTNVPTAALGWSHKYDGIMKRLDMLEYSYSFETLDNNDFIRRFKDFAERTQEIKGILTIQSRKERDSASEAIEVIIELIESLLDTHSRLL